MDANNTFKSMSRFVLRAPTLPFDVLTEWSRLPGEAARRDALRTLVDDPVVREALYVASPELDRQIAGWRREPETPAGVAVERALVRYVSRMASRSTPFGLFASVSVGSTGPATDLLLPPRVEAQRRTRLDNDFLFALCSDLAKDETVRARLRYRPSSSLYVAAARLRYAEARLAGSVRTYHLVAVDRTSYLDALIARAASGATRGELTEILCEEPEIARDEASAFVDDVIAAQILVPDIAPAVTGREPTEGIIDTLESYDLGRYAAPLREAWRALREIDAAPAGVPADAYRRIETQLAASVPTKVEASRLFQVDTFKPAPDAVLGEAVAAELREGIALLHSLTPASLGRDWEQFRDRFVARYETREVPLLEVLDEEVGIGFGDRGAQAKSAPLLADLAFPTWLEVPHAPVRPRDAHLMSLVAGALRTGAKEIELTDDDIEKLREPRPLPLPNLVTGSACLIARSSEAVAAGEYQLRINGVSPGANLLGRFCNGSQEVRDLTDECVRAEQAFHPDAVFAEIVHLPEGRLGNLLLRPVLRGYEIPYLGTSGVDPDKQIAPDDLLVSVVDDRVVLRSKRLDKEVIPRLTTAHNYSWRSLTVYRFLCSHASQNVGYAGWTWGLADQMPFLPRVRRGKLILERARWLLGKADLTPIEAAFSGAAKTAEQIRAMRGRVADAVEALRKRLDLPRWIVIGDGDNELPVDLDNELMVDSAAHLLKGRGAAIVYELLPGPDHLCVHGSEGSFSHELLVILAKPAPVTAARRPVPAAADPSVPRRFVPGSSWLYLKLYTGSATADLLLREYLSPAIRDALDRGIAERWFFLRYADPELHLRLRFSGDPHRLTGELLPLLHRALAPATERGMVWRIALDTYEREVERYGGPEAIDAAERLFWIDSDCVLSMLETLEGDAGAEVAWRLTLCGIDRLLDDFGLPLTDKLATMTAARDGFGAAIGMDTAFQKRLGDKFRAHRAEIATLLDTPHDDPNHPLGRASRAIAARSRRLEPLAHELRALEAAGRLREPVSAIVHSYVHMHVNRMIRSAQRQHEVVLYDLLRRHYDGVIARRKRVDKVA